MQSTLNVVYTFWQSIAPELAGTLGVALFHEDIV
jgi:hypothetical protein